MSAENEEQAAQQVNVTYYFNDWWPGKNVQYTAQIAGETIEQRRLEFAGEHKEGKSAADVTGVRFDDCDMTFLPVNVATAFPAMRILLVFGSKITRLTADDLRPFPALRELWFSSCKLEHLPGDLFEYVPELEIVSFQSCELKFIDSELLERVPRLKVAKFNHNVNIDCFHDSVSTLADGHGLSLADLKRELRKPALRNPSAPQHLPAPVAADLGRLLADDAFTDVTVVVAGREFRAHRLLLAARSRVLKERLLADAAATTLELDDVSDGDVFEALLRYMYDNRMPTLASNPFDIFKAATTLGLERVASYVGENMLLPVTQDNALELLICGREFMCERLRDNAVVEIKKMFPGRQLRDEQIVDTERLRKIRDARIVMERRIREAREDFENSCFFD